jgi:hypothetical protein
MDTNPFLRDFIKMRKTLGSPDTTGKPKDKEPKLSGMSMETIIEKKPPAKSVMKFFKKRFSEDSCSEED